MRVPGSNLAAMALRVIAKQSVIYYRNLGRTTTDIGTLVSTYDNPKDIKGSFQPVSRNLYEKYGLEFNKNYAIFYCPKTNIQDVQRGMSGDVIIFNGQQYNALADQGAWFAIDGWVSPLFVQVPNQFQNFVALESGLGFIELEDDSGVIETELPPNPTEAQ